MTDLNVQPATTPSEPSAWADIAAELHRIADDCVDLVGEPAPAMFQLNIQPGRHGAAESVEAVDAAAAALLSRLAVTRPMNGGTHHRHAAGQRGQIGVSIYQVVPGPPDERDAELARLRAENERLRAAITGERFSRDADDVVQPGRIKPHFESGRIPPTDPADVPKRYVKCFSTEPHEPHETTFAPATGIENGMCPGVMSVPR